MALDIGFMDVGLWWLALIVELAQPRIIWEAGLRP